MASQMPPAVYDTVAADIAARAECHRSAPQGPTLKFKGFTAVYVESREEERSRPRGRGGERDPAAGGGRGAHACWRLDPKQHFTQPPPRYTEASLVKALEELGIGRPSTYASILGTIINDRGYVRRERRTLFPTQLGIEVTDLLQPFFPEIMDVEFTAQMEDSLDRIEDGDRPWTDTVKEFYAPLRARPAPGREGDAQRQGGDRDGRGLPGLRSAPPRALGPLRQVPGLLGLSRVPLHARPERQRARRRRAHGRDVPDVRQADGHQARALRQVHRVLGLSGVQDHQARHPRHRLPASRAAPGSWWRAGAGAGESSMAARRIPPAPSRSGSGPSPRPARSAGRRS